MASNFPTSLDSFTNPLSGDKLDSPSHSTQHANANDAIEGLETKIGIGASPAGSATAGYAFVHSSGGTTAWSQVEQSSWAWSASLIMVGGDSPLTKDHSTKLSPMKGG